MVIKSVSQKRILFAVFVLLILISVYDFIAVFKIKHMITLAKFQTKSKVFAGLFVPYRREKAKEKTTEKSPGKKLVNFSIRLPDG